MQFGNMQHLFGKHIALFLTLPTLKMKAVHSSKTMVTI